MSLFIGKWDTANRFLTVEQHLIDTASAMRYLLKRNVTEQTVNASNLSRKEFEKLAIYCAYIHDIGKCTAAFQYKVPWKRAELLEEGFDPDYVEKSPHALAGAAIQNIVFGVPESICDITAAHHGSTRERGRAGQYRYQKKKYVNNYFLAGHSDSYLKEWNQIYNDAIRESEIEEWPAVSINTQFLVTGLVIMADWIASNEDYFPLGEVPNQRARFETGIKKLDLPDIWSPSYATITDEIFAERFGFYPNRLQEEAIQIAEEEAGPGLMIIESTMGSGKTEAALSAAELLSYYSGTGGIYFGLPTQATANGLLPRVSDWAADVSIGVRTSIRLAHGNAGMNEFYKQFSISDSKGITVNQWLSGRHRALLSDFVVGTVDQILMSSLRQKFFMLLHYGMSGKTIIIDEVHAYDTYMSSYMENVLAWLGNYAVPVILLSATLTEQKRNAFVKAYTGKALSENVTAYPCITWANKAENYVRPVDLNMPEKQIGIQKTDRKQLIKEVMEDLQSGGCAGIITNYVSEAQKIADELKEAFPVDYNIILIHARYLPEHREKLEKEVTRLVGKKSKKKDRNKVIIVGTQVLEQSLDIDLDVLYTELCPMDLLLQRIGRLHRHTIHDAERPDTLKNPICKVYETEGKSIYHPYIIMKTRDTLPHKISLPSDIRPLIEQVYDINCGVVVKEKEDYKKYIREMTIHAGDFMLPYPEECREFTGLTTDAAAMESVRYKMNSMNVLLLVRHSDGSLSCFDGRNIADIPNPEDMAAIGEQVLKLYYEENVARALQLQELPSWTGKYTEKFLIVDENGNADFEKISFNYSEYYGLRRVKK